jgi:class 3 adenylate cyclase
MSWSKQTTRERVNAAIAGLGAIDVADLVRETNLSTIPLNKAYRVDGVHAYVDIPNAVSLLGSGGGEGERSHKRLLRFLHLYQRAAQLVFKESDATKVDHQNQRLHFVVHKPYDDESKRICMAIAVANLLHAVILGANEHHDELPDAKVCIGIDSGRALVVTNGTRGDREPLFIGNPANLAAKLVGPDKEGVFLGETARKALGGTWIVDDYPTQALTSDQLAECVSKARLDLTPAGLLERWEEDLKSTPLVDFGFSRATPPLSDLDMGALSPANSRRLEAMVIMADIDGFTRYVADALAKGTAGAAVRLLHVIRKELRDVLTDFGGRKIRYVGDCLVGVLTEGDARTTDTEKTVTNAVRCAAAMRDAFGIIQEALPEASSLGIGIGMELGPVVITRLGLKGSRDRVVAGRAVLAAQGMQELCSGKETALGPLATSHAVSAVKRLFEDGRATDLNYNAVMASIENEAEQTSKASDASKASPTIVIPRAHCR